MHNMSHGREKFLNIKHVHISRHDEDQAKERDTTIPTATTTEVLGASLSTYLSGENRRRGRQNTEKHDTDTCQCLEFNDSFNDAKSTFYRSRV